MMPDDISALIAELGRALTLRKVASAAYSPSTGTAAVTPTDYAVTGLLLNYKNREREGSLIKAGDRKAVLKVSNMTVVPAVSDLIVVESKAFLIVDVGIIEESGAAVAYICQIRG